MNKPELILLVSPERSGTHYLRSIINNNHAGCCHWEVANAESTIEDHDTINFFSFKDNYQKKIEGTPRPSLAFTTDLLNAYFDLCCDFAQQNRYPLILDIKHGHLVNFASGWWNFSDAPLVFDVGFARNIKFISLRRRNLYKQALSNIYALKTNHWKIYNDESTQRSSIRIERFDLIKQKEILETTQSKIDDWLEPYNPCHLIYEELTFLGSPSFQRLNKLLACDISDLNSEYSKVISSYESQIENYDEIKDLIDFAK